MNLKVYEINYDETITASGSVAGDIVSYDITFSDQGAQGPAGPIGPQGIPGAGVDVLTTQGDTLYQGATTAQRLPIGTAGQVLRVNSGATAPEWTAQGALLEANNLSDVANPATALTNIGGVPTSRTISAGTGLTGGGDLTANRTLTVAYGTTSGTACEGNDSRLSDARTPTSHTHTPSEVGLGNVTNTAQVTSVSGTAPIVSSGGTTPAISISAATTSAAGSMSAADKTKLDGIASGATANSSDATLLNRANHTGTQAASTITSLPVELVIACSDETSNLTTGTAKVTFRAPYAFTLTGVRASVNTAPTGSTLIVDINENGTSVLSTKLSIAANQKTSLTAATAAVISDSAIASDAEITIDIDQIGSTTAGRGLKVVLIGTRA